MDNSLKLLEVDWDTLLADKKWADLGKCLRAIIKVTKFRGQLSHTSYDTEKRIKILEQNLCEMEPKLRFAVVGDILYARRAIDSSSTQEYGSAFKTKPDRIRKG